MGLTENQEMGNDSGSEDEKSSASESESSDSGSDSDSKSEGGSIASPRSGGSHSRSQSPENEEQSSRSGSAQSKSSSDANEEGNLVLDESKGRSRSTSRSSQGSSRSRSESAASEKSDKSQSGKSDEDNDHKDTAHSSPTPEEQKKKIKQVIESDEESMSSSETSGKGKEKGETSTTAEALFGENLDISSEDEDEEKQSTQKRAKPLSDTEEKDEDMEVEEEDQENEKEKEPEESVPETRIEHEIPYIRADVGKEFHFVKLPNFLSVEPRPFDPETYEDELEEEETLDEEGRARLKLKVENTIRWRTAFDKEGNAFKESNARMVKWSDGSLSLHLGSEIFDVYRQPLQGDHNHLFIRQGTGLQGQAVFRTKLTFRPHSTDSFTHRKMTKSLAERSTKTSAVKIISAVGADPEAHRGEMIKKEEERLRASMRRESKQKKVRERTATGRSMGGSYLEPDRDGYEDSDDEGAISLTAIKNKYKKGGDIRPSIYSSEDDASDIEDRKSKKFDRPKALRDSDDEDEGTSGGKTRIASSDSEEESD